MVGNQGLHFGTYLVKLVVADGEEVKVDLGVELVRSLTVDLACREAIRETGAVVKVTRVDEEQIGTPFLGELPHVRNERSKVAPIAGVVGLRIAAFLMSHVPAVDVCNT